MIVMLIIVLIGVICIVHFTVYASTGVMWYCTYMFCELLSLNLYITSCVLNFSLQFLYIRCFGECEPFFFFLEKGFLEKLEHHKTKYS